MSRTCSRRPYVEVGASWGHSLGTSSGRPTAQQHGRNPGAGHARSPLLGGTASSRSGLMCRRLSLEAMAVHAKGSARDRGGGGGGAARRHRVGRPSAVAPERLLPVNEQTRDAQNKRFDIKFIHMQVLWAVSHLGSYEKAGALLGLQHSTVRKYLANLERCLEVQLFKEKLKASGHAMEVLSDAGNVMLYYSEQTLLLAQDACQALSDINNLKLGSLSVGISQTARSLLLPQLVNDFLLGHSDVNVDLTVADTPSLCAAVTSGRLDCGIVGDDIPGSVRDVLKIVRVKREKIVLAVSRSHEFAQRKSISPDELYGIDFCACNLDGSRASDYSAALRTAGVRTGDLRVRSYVNSLDALRDLVALGAGAAFLPASAAGADEGIGGRIAVVPVEGIRPIHNVNLVTDPRRYCSRTQRTFLYELFQVAPVCRIDTLQEPCQAPSLLPLESYDCSFPSAAGLGGATSRGTQGGIIADCSGWRAGFDLSEGGEEAGEEQQQQEEQEGEEEEEEEVDPLVAMSRGSLLRLMSSQRSARSISGQKLPVGNAKQQLADHLPFKLADLQLFHAVVKFGSFTGAAAHYRFAVSTVHYSIQRLERNLNLQIVDTKQGKNRVVLTEAGELLQHYAHRMMLLLEETLKAMNDVRDVRTGNVNLGASQTTGTYLVPRLIGIFRARNPFVSVNLQVSSSQNICASVAEGKVDVALVGSRVPEALEDRLVATPYATDELVLIVSRQHPLAASRTIEKDDLYSLNFVSVKEGSTVQAMQCRILKQQGIKWQDLRIDLEFDSIEAIKSAVRYNLGAAFVSVSAIEKELQLGLIAQVPIRELRLLRTLYLVSNPRGYLSPAAEKFMAEVLHLQPGAASNHAAAVSAQLRLSHSQSRPWEGSKRTS